MADEVAEKPEKPRIRAEDNRWYWLATLYGVPDRSDEGLQARNRVAWNRCMAPKLTGEAREHLMKTNRAVAGELAQSQDQQQEVEAALLQRSDGRSAGVAELVQSEIDFSRVEFERLPFAGMIFPDVRFDSATFSGDADFAFATFSGDADFTGATFSGDAGFAFATFSGYASFAGATFSGSYADFDSATFSGNVRFDSATFSGSYADFDSATFSGNAGFINVEMKAPTSFQRAKFFAPPEFFGAKLHEGTVWRDVVWPKLPKDAEQAGLFVDAYERLKLEMDRLKKQGDELDFFARELQCRRVRLGFWRGLPIEAYGFPERLLGRSYMSVRSPFSRRRCSLEPFASRHTSSAFGSRSSRTSATRESPSASAMPARLACSSGA